MSTVKKSTPKRKAAVALHPTYAVMIQKAIQESKERGGCSRQKIAAYVRASFKVGPNADSQVKLALKRLVKQGSLIQTKGTGASGSFKIASKKPAPPAKKPAAPKKPAARKAVKSPKKAASKKTTQKKTSSAKSPAKRAKSSVAKKTPEKKAKKPAAKKPATKKATPKKSVKKTATTKKTAKK